MAKEHLSSSFAGLLAEQVQRMKYARNAHIMQPGDTRWAYFERSERAKLVTILDNPRRYY